MTIQRESASNGGAHKEQIGAALKHVSAAQVQLRAVVLAGEKQQTEAVKAARSELTQALAGLKGIQ